MTIPDKTNLRLVFKINDEYFTKYYWFRMRNDELYWGSPYKSRIYDFTAEIKDNKTNITIPDDFDELPPVDSHISYHKSGQVHIKNITKDKERYSKPNQWPLKNEIVGPVNIFTTLSKVINHYDEKISNPDRKKNRSIRFGIPIEATAMRFYMECFLCPAGTFDFPMPTLQVPLEALGVVNHSLNKDLVLVIRYAIVDVLLDWHPDKELSFLPTSFK